ncbi:MAG: hypothetical protein WA958_07035 [Tunicatimonas sp.]
MPYLMIAGNRDGGGAYPVQGLQLLNKGVGPAFIQSVRIRYQDTLYEQDPPRFYFSNVKPPDSVDYSINNASISLGYVVSAGEQLLLIEPNSEYSASVINELFFGDNRAIAEITYSSIYDEVWQVSNEKYVPEKID